MALAAPRGERGARWLGDPGIEPDLHLPVAAARADLVWTEQDVPRTRCDRPGRIRRRCPVRVDGELELVAAAPATEARASRGDAALVEEADVERVPAGDGGVGVDAVAVRVAQVQLAATSRHVER